VDGYKQRLLRLLIDVYTRVICKKPPLSRRLNGGG